MEATRTEKDRVAAHTASSVNREIRQETDDAVAYYARHPGEIDARLDALTKELVEHAKAILAEIQNGSFTRNWMLENRVNQTSFKATRAKLAEHPIEEVGAKLRDMMPWIAERKMVDKSKN